MNRCLVRGGTDTITLRYYGRSAPIRFIHAFTAGQKARLASGSGLHGFGEPQAAIRPS